MSETRKQEPAQHRAELPSSNIRPSCSQTAPEKRSADDEVQFISSNPVKKTKLTGQLTNHTAQGLMAPPPRPLHHEPSFEQQTLAASRVPTVERCRSLCGIVQPMVPAPVLKNRGASLPVLDSFVFPQAFAPLPFEPRRLSEAISPKQLPQNLSTASAATVNTDQTPPSVTNTASQASVTLDQISCLDFNGIPTNTPGFDASRIFSAEGVLMSATEVGDMTPTTQSPSPVNPFTGQNAIPFAMYSTGSLVPMIPTHSNGQPPASFPSLSTQNQPSTPGPSLPAQNRPRQQVPGMGSHNIVSNQGSHFQKSQHHPGQQGGGNPSSSCSSSPALGPKPPCLHCARIKQQNLLRQAQESVKFSQDLVQSHQRGSQLSIHHLSPAQVSENSPRRASPQQVPSPRSTPAPEKQRPHLPAVLSAYTRPSTPARVNPNPNLLQDIAQTIQVTFPYAQVAGRHGVQSEKVAELLANTVITPLLRRTGQPLGTG